jgi:uncharacterized membrane protein
MPELIVITYDDIHQAEEVRLKLLKMQKEYLIDLEDAVVVVKDKNGKIKLRQMYDLTATGAMKGGFFGILIGLLFLNPLLGLVVGSASGAVGGALSDVGIKDNFMKELAANIKQGGSMLFVLVRKVTPDKVLDQLQGAGGQIVQTSLTHEEEDKLQDALDAARTEGTVNKAV